MRSLYLPLIFLTVALSTSTSGFAQKQKIRFPLWTFHQRNVDIYGVSLGFFSTVSQKNTTTNGLKIELIGLGLAGLMIPESPVAGDNDGFTTAMSEAGTDQVNGIQLATTGSVCHCDVQGLSLGGMLHIHRRINGISAAFVMNFSQEHNGLQLAIINSAYEMSGLQFGFGNQAQRMRGVQFGLLNQSSDTRGLQVGLWNVNEKRKLPLINWSF